MDWLQTSSNLVLAGLMSVGMFSGLGSLLPPIVQRPTPAPSVLTQSNNAPETFTTETTGRGGFPRTLKIAVSLTEPDDLKVSQGQQVREGQVLADRTKQRQRLVVQRREAVEALKRIEQRKILPPAELRPVPQMTSLPEPNYAQEEAAIAAAKLRLEEAKAAYRMHQISLKQQPAGPASAVARQEIELQKRQRATELQSRQLDAVATLHDLPPEVREHEHERLKQLTDEADQARAELELRKSELNEAVNQQNERLRQLDVGIQKAQSELELAQGKLQAARQQRQQKQYEHELAQVRWVQDNNAAQATIQRQQQEYQQQLRERDFQLAQLRRQIADIENNLAQLSTIRSPVNGTIRRIKWEGQRDQNLAVSITIVPAVGSTSPRSNPSPNQSPEPPNRGSR
jgi:hypothetical protein